MKNLEKLKTKKNESDFSRTLKNFGRLYLSAPGGSAERQFYKFTYKKYKKKYSN